MSNRAPEISPSEVRQLMATILSGLLANPNIDESKAAKAAMNYTTEVIRLELTWR